MEFQFSERAESFQPNIFNVLNEKKRLMIEQGRTVYNLTVGTPDFPPDAHVVRAMAQAASKPENYKYSLEDLPQLKDAVQNWYQNRYGVSLEQDEIMSVYGSQEGIAHIALTICNEGDIILAPNPCYPIFEAGPFLSGAKVEYYSLLAENDYIPDLDSISQEILQKTKMIIVSYPANPVCALATPAFYEKLIAFAKKHTILVVHDNAYSEITYDGTVGGSFLKYEGAKEVGVEFNSLSKSYNLTGARVSFLVGNQTVIKKFKTIRSQIDYGMFYPIQYAAIAALNGPQDSVVKNRKTYQARRDALCRGLSAIGWHIPDAKGTMFAWAPLPKGYDDSDVFCMELLEKTGVMCTPGSNFGSLGKQYVRFALVLPVETIQEMIAVIDKSGMIQK